MIGKAMCYWISTVHITLGWERPPHQPWTTTSTDATHTTHLRPFERVIEITSSGAPPLVHDRKQHAQGSTWWMKMKYGNNGSTYPTRRRDERQRWQQSIVWLLQMRFRDSEMGNIIQHQEERVLNPLVGLQQITKATATALDRFG